MTLMPRKVDTLLDNPAGKWCSLGLDYVYQKKFDYALTCFDSAIAVNENYCMAWLLKGILLSLTEKQDGAISSYKKAIEISPKKVQKTFEKKFNEIIRILKPEESVKRHVIKNFDIAMAEFPLSLTWCQKISKIIKDILITPSKGSIDHAQIVKIEQLKIEVTKKIAQIFEYKIPEINDAIQSTYDKAYNAKSEQEEIFLAKKIKGLQNRLNSKWITLNKLQSYQQYFEKILDFGDIGTNLEAFGLPEFSGKKIEDIVIDIKLNSDEMERKMEFTDDITSTAINHDAGEEGLKDILDVIRSKKE